MLPDLEYVDNSGSEDKHSDKQGGGDNRDVKEPQKMGRQYTNEEKQAIDELGRWTVQEADVIATRFGRKWSDILIRAGLGMKLMNKNNISNVFKTWYAANNDMDEGSK